MPSPTEITPTQLARLIGTPECPILIDVCIDEDFEAAPHLLPTAFRHPFGNIESLVPRLSDKCVVVICHKGLKLSQGAAAILRSHGVMAESLQGGLVGWREAGLPEVKAKAVPKLPGRDESLWVTRHRPKIDRIACPWLIRRFVDPQARFLFVSPSEVMNVADRFGATPFDVPDVPFSHRGELCTFDTMIEAFGLDLAPLNHLATIVRAADTNRPELASEAAGLLAVSLGLSRQFRDDLEQLEAGMAVYDALFRWSRDARGETHNWPVSESGISAGQGET